MTIPKAVAQLLEVVQQLRDAHPHKRFTLDGRLVGDIGEVLVSQVYQVELAQGLQRHHDGTSVDGRAVQIKATMQKSLTFPADHVPDYYIGVVIHPNGTIEEVFNGPGATAAKAIAQRAHPKTNLHSISVTALRRLNELVPEDQRIPKRESAA